MAKSSGISKSLQRKQFAQRLAPQFQREHPEITPVNRRKIESQAQERRRKVEEQNRPKFNDAAEQGYDRFRRWLDDYETSDEAIEAYTEELTTGRQAFIENYLPSRQEIEEEQEEDFSRDRRLRRG